MPPTALALVLTAALLHALWNIAAKKAGGNHHFALLSVLMTVVLWAPAALWFGIDEWQRWGLIEWAALGASASVHVLYFTVLLTGYRKADLTVVYPVARGSGPLLASIGAVLVLGETITLLPGRMPMSSSTIDPWATARSNSMPSMNPATDSPKDSSPSKAVSPNTGTWMV